MTFIHALNHHDWKESQNLEKKITWILHGFPFGLFICFNLESTWFPRQYRATSDRQMPPPKNSGQWRCHRVKVLLFRLTLRLRPRQCLHIELLSFPRLKLRSYTQKNKTQYFKQNADLFKSVLIYTNVCMEKVVKIFSWWEVSLYQLA